MSHDPHVKSFLVENKDRVVETFATLIRQAQEKEEISTKKDPETLALFLFSSLQGLRLTSMIEPNLEAVTDEILTIL